MKIIPIDRHTILRELQRGDAPDIFEAIDTQRTYLGRWLPFVEHTLQVGDSMAFVEATLTAAPYEYTFTLRDGDRFAGLAGFKSTDRTTLTTEIGYWMREEFQGRGLMTRAVEALCRFALSELGMERVEIKCARGNEPSNRIPQRLGFRLDRTESHGELLAEGEWVDLNVYAVERATLHAPTR